MNSDDNEDLKLENDEQIASVDGHSSKKARRSSPTVEESTSDMIKVTKQVVQEPRFTHFLSIPFNNPEFKKSFTEFKMKVLGMETITRGGNITESYFQNPQKLHLTFGIMNLSAPENEQKAIDLLKKCNQELIQPILQSNPLRVDIKSVKIMNDNPEKAHILYAVVSNEKKLQQIADAVANQFIEAGLIVEPRNGQVKLHITLLNSVFDMRKRARELRSDFLCNGKRKKESPKRVPFDATNLIQEFKDYVFAEDLNLSEIHISHAVKVDFSSGYYLTTSKINFP